ncbi:MAG: homoserine dehydrogenase [Kiritimatiellae bacterium]|nr:homoserine dehydrogenase [Kiritimatiellia bacterium]
MKQIGVGILGFGTVGAGVADGLLRNRETFARRLGVDVVLKKIADLDIERDRGVKVPREVLTTDAMEAINDPEIQIIVELIGGTGIAKKLILAAIASGKNVVTANKKLLSESGREIFEAATAAGVDIYFGAAVGGGIPIIRSLREGLAGNEIESMKGILNGTCNYILTRMIREGAAFAQVLADAQKLGFAEADPTLDIDGWDTAHKASLLASLAYSIPVDPHKIEVKGIRNLSNVDVVYAGKLGYSIKLLAQIDRVGDQVAVGVYPTLIPEEHMLSAVNGVFNAVMVHGDLSDDLMFYGKGAGRAPTASTVVGDIGDIARNLAGGGARYKSAIRYDNEGKLTVMPAGEVRSEFYIRLMVEDRCGTFGQFGTMFGNHNVSIRLATSHEFLKGQEMEGIIPVVVRTHVAKTSDVEAAIAEIEASGIVRGTPVVMRMVK